MNPPATHGFLAYALTTGFLALGDLRAQTSPSTHLTLETGVAALRATSRVDATDTRFDGVGIAVSGSLQRGYLILRARYVDGTATTPDAGTPDRGVADAMIGVGVRVLDWLSVEVGPRARAYSTETSTQRWRFVDVRLAGQRTVIDDRAAVDLELWRSVSGGFHESVQFDGGSGGEVGLTLKAWPPPIWVRLAYRIDRGTGTQPVRWDTFEHLLVTARLTL